MGFRSFLRWFDAPFRRSLGFRLPHAPLKAMAVRTLHYLCTATIVKNEARFINEFVAFHQMVGVDHMLIYDDESVDNLQSVLESHIIEGFVTLIPWPRFVSNRNNQFLAYQHALALMRGKCTWLAMIDADEFLFAPESGDLKDELRRLERYPAVGVFSRTFGTSKIKEVPGNALVTQTFRYSAPGDYIKNCTHRTIAKPEHVLAVRSANSCVLRDTPYLGWDERGVPISRTGETGHTSIRLRINHYFTRAQQDLEQKIARSYFGKTCWEDKMKAKLKEAADLDAVCVEDPSLDDYSRKLAGLFKSKNVATRLLLKDAS